MTYILLWLLCSYCAYKLFKNYVTSNLIHVGIFDASIAQAMRNAAKKDVSFEEIQGAPDNVINAIFWTIILVESLLIWPVNLVVLVWWQVFDKQDFSDFRG